MDLHGDLLVVDSEAHMVRKVELSKVAGDSSVSRTRPIAGKAGVAELADGPCADSRFDKPKGIASAKDGLVYVCDSGNSIVRCISADQRFVSTVPGNFPGLRSIDIDLAGALYLMSGDPNVIYRYEGGRTQELYSNWTDPVHMAVDSISGILFVIDQHQVLQASIVKNVAPTHPTISTDIVELFCGDPLETFADICFQVEGKKVFAHRCVLASRAPSFRPTLRKAEGVDDVIDRPHRFRPFVALMVFLYTDICIVDSTTDRDLLQLADTYDLDRLKRLVEEYMVKRVNVENVLEIFLIAHVSHAVRLKQATLRVINRWWDEVQPKLPTAGIDNPELLMEIITNVPKSHL
jgi:hypothetical protein